jgi:hypothetical protein
MPGYHNGAYTAKDSIRTSSLLDHISREQVALAGPSVPDVVCRVLILENCPYIAIRYPLGNGHIHRMQMNFATNVEFGRALELLRSSGVPIHHKELAQKSDLPEVNSSTAALSAHALSAHALSAHAQSGPPVVHHGSSGAPNLPQCHPLRYADSQPESYAASVSSQPSQWLTREHEQPSRPLIGPSLVESDPAHEFQLPPRPHYQSSGGLYMHNKSHAPQPPVYRPEYRYHVQEQRVLHTSHSAESDPVRQTLFSSSCGSEESFGRPGTAPAGVDALNMHVPPRRELPFSKSPPKADLSNPTATDTLLHPNGTGSIQAIDPRPMPQDLDIPGSSHSGLSAAKKKTAPKRKREAAATSAMRKSSVWTSPDTLAMLPSPLQSFASYGPLKATTGSTNRPMTNPTPPRTVESASATNQTSPQRFAAPTTTSSARLPLLLSFTKPISHPQMETTTASISNTDGPPGKKPKVAPPSRPQTRSQRGSASQEQQEESRVSELGENNMCQGENASNTPKATKGKRSSKQSISAAELRAVVSDWSNLPGTEPREFDVMTESARSSVEPRKSARLTTAKPPNAKKGNKAAPRKAAPRKPRAVTAKKAGNKSMKNVEPETGGANATQDSAPSTALKPTNTDVVAGDTPVTDGQRNEGNSTGAIASTHISEPLGVSASAALAGVGEVGEPSQTGQQVKSIEPAPAPPNSTAAPKRKRPTASKKRKAYVSTIMQTTPYSGTDNGVQTILYRGTNNGVQTIPYIGTDSGVQTILYSGTDSEVQTMSVPETTSALTPATSATPPPASLDVSYDWLAIVEGFVLRHRDRILGLPNVLDTADPNVGHNANTARTSSAHEEASRSANPPPVWTGESSEAKDLMPSESSAEASAAAAVNKAIHETNAGATMEQLVIACIKDPFFEQLCEEVAKVWASFGVEVGGDVEMEI